MQKLYLTNYTSDEYARMLAQQSQEMIVFQEKVMTLEENNRLQKIEIKSLKEENEKLQAIIKEMEGEK